MYESPLQTTTTWLIFDYLLIKFYNCNRFQSTYFWLFFSNFIKYHILPSTITQNTPKSSLVFMHITKKACFWLVNRLLKLNSLLKQTQTILNSIKL